MHQPPLPIRIKTVLKVKVLVTQSCPTLYGPLNCNTPGFSADGILQTRILEWVAIPFSRGSSPSRDETHISYVWFVLFYCGNQCDFSVTQSCLTLCGPMDCSVLGYMGFSSAGLLEWIAISFYRGSFQPRNWTYISRVSCTGWWILYHWAIWEHNIVNQLSFSSVQFSHSVVSNSLQPHESQHARPPCLSHLQEFTQTHIHPVGDAIQPSHPLSSPSPPAPNPSQHQSLSNESTLHMRCSKYWSFRFSIIPFKSTPRTDLL